MLIGLNISKNTILKKVNNIQKCFVFGCWKSKGMEMDGKGANEGKGKNGGTNNITKGI